MNLHQSGLNHRRDSRDNNGSPAKVNQNHRYIDSQYVHNRSNLSYNRKNTFSGHRSNNTSQISRKKASTTMGLKGKSKS